MALHTAEEYRSEFIQNIKNWPLDKKNNPDGPKVDTPLQQILLEGYDDLMSFAARIGALQSNQKLNIVERLAQSLAEYQPYDPFSIEPSMRSQIMQGLAVMPMWADILASPQVQNNEEVAKSLVGRVVRQAAVNAMTLEYISSDLLINEDALGVVSLQDAKQITLQQRQKMREVK